MSRILKNITVAYCTASAGLVGTYYYFTKDIQTVPIGETPRSFRSIISSSSTYGYFRRNNYSSNLSIALKALFTQPFYEIEYLISSTSYNPEFQLKLGQKIGNLVVEQIPAPNQVILRYQYPGFNYKYFIQVNDGCMDMGFVEYTGSFLQDIGTRWGIKILLQGAK
ncbi:hypothetical protein HDV04_003084 [Boothiomyces sp. JEL0838]|nr:hypothetical protein HDV04_003084 [Boothiomyces sp. JEL0838]